MSKEIQQADANPRAGGAPAEPANGFAAYPAAGFSGSSSAGSSTGKKPDAPNAMSLLFALKRRLPLALGAAVLASSLGGAAAWLLAPQAKYKAQAVLHVAAQPPKVIFGTVETQEGSVNEYVRYQKTQAGMARSRMVLNAALQRDEVKRLRMVQEQEDPVKWLQDRLEIDFETGSELLDIGLAGDDPDELAMLVNAVKNAYMEEVVNADRKLRQDRFDKLIKLKGKYADSIKRQRENLKSLAEKVGSDDRQTLALKQQFALEHMASVEKELLDVQSQKRKAQVELKYRRQAEDFQETAARSISEFAIAEAVEQEPTVARLRDRLATVETTLKSETANTRKIARNAPSDPSLKRLRSEVALLKQELSSQRKALRPMVIRQLQSEEGDVKKSESEALQEQLAVLDDLEARLKAEITQLDEGSHSLTVNTLDLQTIQDDMTYVQGAAGKVGSEVEALTVEIEAPARVRLIEEAVPPRSRDEKKRYMIVGLVTAGSFFFGLFGVAFLELQTQKVDSTEEVVVGLGLPIVGTLPLLPQRVRLGGPGGRSEKHRYWHNLLLESIDAARTMLVHASLGRSYRAIMITSAISGEGKTSLATQLATSLARSGLRTLLIDADLRRPSIHQLFDLPPGPGLSELLRNEVSSDDVIASTSIPELSILVAGRCDPQALRDLSLGGFAGILEPLRPGFDYVIVDSSPVLPVADALMVAQQVDAVLFSILRDVSRKTKIFAAYQRLSTLGVPILGAVVTGAQGGLYGTDHYGGGRYSAAYPAVEPPIESES